jgi:hypothetical protein
VHPADETGARHGDPQGRHGGKLRPLMSADKHKFI